MGKGKTNQYEAITDRVLAAMDKGQAPWRKPWKSLGGGLPINGKSGKAYRGVNVLLTWMTAMDRGYSSNIWVTFKQANEIAGTVARKEGHKVEKNKKGTWVFSDGEKKGKSVGGIQAGQNAKNGKGATSIVFWKTGKSVTQNEEGEDVSKNWMMLRTYNVFAMEQCDEGVQAYLKAKHKISDTPLSETEILASAEAICEGYEIDTRHGGDRAYYSPKGDYIQMPTREQFEDAPAYYTTRFHEMGHSTGAVGRLHRKGVAEFDYFGSHQYAEEELVAEAEVEPELCYQSTGRPHEEMPVGLVAECYLVVLERTPSERP